MPDRAGSTRSPTRTGLASALRRLGELCGFLESFLGGPVSLLRVFHRLPGIFVRGQVVFFAVMRRSNKVRVRREVVKLSRSPMRVLGHDFLLFPAHNSTSSAGNRTSVRLLTCGPEEPGAWLDR